MMPNDPVVGGTALRRTAINSPNFNLQNPSASPNPSWAILQSGVAFFFGLVLTGGTLIGPDYIINPTGMFFYSGPPAFGSLSQSVVPGANPVTDPEGNAALPGFTTYEFNAGTYYANNILAGQIVIWTATNAAGPYTQSAAGIFFLKGANTFINALVGQKIELSAPTIADFTLESAGAFTADTTADVTGAFTAHSTADILAAFKAHTTAEIIGALTADTTADVNGAFTAHSTADILAAFKAHTTAEIVGALTADNSVTLVAIATPASSAGNAVLFSNTNGELIVIDGLDLTTYATQRRSLVFNTTQTSTTTFTTVSGLSSAVSSGRTYRFRAQICWVADQSAGQVAFRFNGPTSVAPTQASFDTGSLTSHWTPAPVGLAATSNPGLTMVGGQAYVTKIEGEITPSANGTFSIQIANVTAGDTFHIVAGTHLDLMPV